MASSLSRRALLLGGLVAAGTGGFFAAGGQNLFYDVITEASAAVALDPVAAHKMAGAGEIILVDIRRPDEWAKTGSGEHAVRLDLRRDDFIAELDKLVAGNRGAPLALICARGVRSARENNKLIAAGFTNVIDVPEGMLGNSKGPGWIKRGLPLNKTP
ncbi:MAG: rhodanese-like domain-containing protein [Litoreibacter sp.]|nr:rhodanese-like domain-containing protein [Litoreibacter sp.]